MGKNVYVNNDRKNGFGIKTSLFSLCVYGTLFVCVCVCFEIDL